jgi:hypothetical protein
MKGNNCSRVIQHLNENKADTLLHLKWQNAPRTDKSPL